MPGIDLWMYRKGFQIILPDVTVDQIRLEEGGSHDDGSEHQWEPAESLSGLIQKCTFCGLEKPYDEDAEDDYEEDEEDEDDDEEG